MELFNANGSYTCLWNFFMLMAYLHTYKNFRCCWKFSMLINNFHAFELVHVLYLFHTSGIFPCTWSFSLIMELCHNYVTLPYHEMEIFHAFWTFPGIRKFSMLIELCHTLKLLHAYGNFPCLWNISIVYLFHYVTFSLYSFCIIYIFFII